MKYRDPGDTFAYFVKPATVLLESQASGQAKGYSYWWKKVDELIHTDPGLFNDVASRVQRMVSATSPY